MYDSGYISATSTEEKTAHAMQSAGGGGGGGMEES